MTNRKKALINLISFITAFNILMTSSKAISDNNIIEYYNSKNEEIMNLYYNGQLKKEKDLEKLELVYAPIDNKFIKELPSNIKFLLFAEDSFIDDLSILPIVCPNLETLSIITCYNINDFSFVKNFSNLKNFYVDENCIGITKDLIDYLNSKNINHNLSITHVVINEKIDEIIDEIIFDDMSENEKLVAITLYVKNHIKYDTESLLYDNKDKINLYNQRQLYYALMGSGVCIQYTALTNALCSKAGIKCNYIKDLYHAWNIVCIDDKYYYVDITNIDQYPKLTDFMLKSFNIGFYYKQDPYSTYASSMSELDNLITKPPISYIEKVNESNNNKNFIEKYCSNLNIDILALSILLFDVDTFIIVEVCGEVKKNKIIKKYNNIIKK